MESDSDKPTAKSYAIIFVSAFVILVSGLLSGCQLVGEDQPDLDKMTVSTGQSFGFCVGYCFRELVVSSDERVLTTKANPLNSPPPEYPTLIETWETSTAQWDSLTVLVDETTFLALGEVYGCPDCADGGSEWIEILFGSGERRRVTFEFGKSVVEIEDLILYARRLRSEAINNSSEKTS